mgnify:CR=1 FL=1
MKVFVTGGHGFLGNALCKKLFLEGFEVEAPTSKQCNLFSDTSLNQYADVKFDLIILDESQDISSLYYEVICKIYKDNNHENAKICIFGAYCSFLALKI